MSIPYAYQKVFLQCYDKREITVCWKNICGELIGQETVESIVGGTYQPQKIREESRAIA